MSAKIIELNPANRRHPMSDDARRLLATLTCGPAIASVLSADMAKLPDLQQRALVAVFAFHLMGGNMPASFEMVKRLPPFFSTSDHAIYDAMQALCDADLLEFNDGYFVSKAILAGIDAAMEAFAGPEETRDPT